MDKVSCDLCPRHCSLSKNERGFCYARGESEGQIILKDYGRLSALSLDPIEKKPLYHFLPGTSILSLGTVGCNLNCSFCQNCHISRDRTGRPLVIEASPRDVVFKCKELCSPSIAFTYNEPIVFHEYALEVASLAKSEGIKTVAVTAGYIEGFHRENFFKNMDAANIDLKGFSEEFYQKNCGADLKTVLETLRYARQETECWLEVTTLLIPDENDSRDELERMTDWYLKNLGPDVPWHFSAFFPRHKMLQKRPTSLEKLNLAKEIAESKGVSFVYLGNVDITNGEDTFCPHCKMRLIARDRFSILENKLKKNLCPHCLKIIPGVFI